jgi:homoserine dehydrogenase
MRVLIAGFGVVGRSVARLLNERGAMVRQRVGTTPVVVGLSDSRGWLADPDGLTQHAIDALDAAKRAGAGVASHAGGPRARSGSSPLDDASSVTEALRHADAQVLIECAPTALHAPGPSLTRVRTALDAGVHVVSVNKAPLATEMRSLRALAEARGVRLLASGTVGAGTPVLDWASRIAARSRVVRVRAIVNGTTNFILTRMSDGAAFDDALGEAQRLGYAETDPSADVDGWDTAAKIVILANQALGRGVALHDVEVRGVREVTRAALNEAAASAQRVKLVGTIDDRGVRVAPELVDAGSPMDVAGSLNAVAMTLEHGHEFTLVGRGAGGEETASAVLRDLVTIWSAQQGSTHVAG